ncbi:hypothetical protein AAHA92_33739 [Salvia divinorum]|uniref:Uncharacterized protein n=1 Tax=Salvia divinorum TaxID=28513 RepID=A0ABD1FQZ7_SALDI
MSPVKRKSNKPRGDSSIGKKRKTSNVEMRLTTTAVHVMDTTDDKRLKVKRTPRNFTVDRPQVISFQRANCIPRAFYADRVIHGQREGRQCYPLIKGWNEVILKQRQDAELKDGAYGLGYPRPQYGGRIIKDIDDIAHVINRVAGMAAGENDLIDGEVERSSTVEEKYMHDLMEASKSMSDSIKKLMSILKNTPREVRKLDCFKVTCDTLRKTIGHAETTSDPELDPIASMTQSMSTEAYRDEEWIEAIDSLVKAAEEMEILDNKDDFPSFSLGFEFTQDLHKGTISVGKMVNAVSGDDGVLPKEHGGPAEVVPEECGVDQMVSDSEYNIEEPVILVTSLQDDQEHIDSMVCSAMEAIMEIGVEAFCSTTSEKGMNGVVEKAKLTHDTAIEEKCDEDCQAIGHTST